MELTESYLRVIPEVIRQRYDMVDVRNAASGFASADLLSGFKLTTENVVKPRI